METAVKNIYEGMFLIDSAEAARDWDGVIKAVETILTRSEAEIVSVRKWDERPLAYTIRKCNRGTYILTYFKVEGEKISDIERDVQLSECVMRVLVLKADHLTEEDIAKDTPATRIERQGRERVAAAKEAEQKADEESQAKEAEQKTDEEPNGDEGQAEDMDSTESGEQDEMDEQDV